MTGKTIDLTTDQTIQLETSQEEPVITVGSQADDVNPYDMYFHDADGKQVACLSWQDGTLHAEGNFSGAAKIFIEVLRHNTDAYIEDLFLASTGVDSADIAHDEERDDDWTDEG